MVLPISTPPNALAQARGEFNTREMARMAVIISAVAALFIVLGGRWIMRLWGVVRWPGFVAARAKQTLKQRYLHVSSRSLWSSGETFSKELQS